MQKLSIIIPLLNEAESIIELHSRICAVLENDLKCLEYEIIFINDGSTDHSEKTLDSLLQNYRFIKVINLPQNQGKSHALMVGFGLAEGQIIVTLDGDLQDRPENIPALIRSIEAGNDLVIGWKKDRKDPKHKIILSKIFNYIVGRIWDIRLHDINSGLKAMKRPLVEKLNLSTNQHRFIAVFAKQFGFKITEICVEHDPRKFGKSKFGFCRLFTASWSLIDLLYLKRRI